LLASGIYLLIPRILSQLRVCQEKEKRGVNDSNKKMEHQMIILEKIITHKKGGGVWRYPKNDNIITIKKCSDVFYVHTVIHSIFSFGDKIPFFLEKLSIFV
jgi:hypothetical protein